MEGAATRRRLGFEKALKEISFLERGCRAHLRYSSRHHREHFPRPASRSRRSAIMLLDDESHGRPCTGRGITGNLSLSGTSSCEAVNIRDGEALDNCRINTGVIGEGCSRWNATKINIDPPPHEAGSETYLLNPGSDPFR